MSTSMRIGVVALLAAFAAIVLPAEPRASCTSGDRIWHGDADCLKASWRNKKWPKKNRYDAQNLCSEHGTVVAKVDIEHHSDETWTLADGNKKSGGVHNDYDVRGIYCCSDSSDLCNKSDITINLCWVKFVHSGVNATCKNASMDLTDDYKCVVSAQCKYRERLTDPDDPHQAWAVRWEDTSITTTIKYLEELRNCSGTLKTSAC